MPLPRPGGLSDAEFVEFATPRQSTQTAESAVPPRTQPRPTIGDASAGGKPPRHAERTAREQNTLAERTAERLGLSPETIREAGIEGEAALTALGMYEYMQDRDKPRVNALAVKLYQAGHDKLAGKILEEIAVKHSIESKPPEEMDVVSLQSHLEGVDQALEFLDFAEPIAGRINPALPGYLGLMRWTLERARPKLENNLKSRFGSH